MNMLFIMKLYKHAFYNVRCKKSQLNEYVAKATVSLMCL